MVPIEVVTSTVLLVRTLLEYIIRTMSLQNRTVGWNVGAKNVFRTWKIIPPTRRVLCSYDYDSCSRSALSISDFDSFRTCVHECCGSRRTGGQRTMVTVVPSTRAASNCRTNLPRPGTRSCRLLSRCSESGSRRTRRRPRFR